MHVEEGRPKDQSSQLVLKPRYANIKNTYTVTQVWSIITILRRSAINRKWVKLESHVACSGGLSKSISFNFHMVEHIHNLDPASRWPRQSHKFCRVSIPKISKWYMHISVSKLRKLTKDIHIHICTQSFLIYQSIDIFHLVDHWGSLNLIYVECAFGLPNSRLCQKKHV